MYAASQAALPGTTAAGHSDHDSGGAGDEEVQGVGLTPAEYLRRRRAGQAPDTQAVADQAQHQAQVEAISSGGDGAASALPSQERLTPATLLLRLGVLRRGAHKGSVQFEPCA